MSVWDVISSLWFTDGKVKRILNENGKYLWFCVYGLFWADKFNLEWPIDENEDPGDDASDEKITNEEEEELINLEEWLINVGKGIIQSKKQEMYECRHGFSSCLCSHMPYYIPISGIASLTILSCYANILVFMDCKNNEFLKIRIMIT